MTSPNAIAPPTPPSPPRGNAWHGTAWHGIAPHDSEPQWKFYSVHSGYGLGARLYLGALTTAFTLSVVAAAAAAIFTFYAHNLDGDRTRCLRFTQQCGPVIQAVFWLFSAALVFQ